MSDQPNGAPPRGAPKQIETLENSTVAATSTAQPKGKPAKNDAKNEAKASDATGDKKLTGAELKARKKAEKAAHRQQSKDVSKGEAAVSSLPQPLGPSASEVKGKVKGKQDGTAAALAGRPVPARAPPSTLVTELKVQIPDCFSHLSMARRIPMTQADKDVHPSVLALGQQMATFSIDESIARLEATLLAIKRVCISETQLVSRSPY
jgi:translation initiation factor eIF-2B subunit delta